VISGGASLDLSSVSNIITSSSFIFFLITVAALVAAARFGRVLPSVKTIIESFGGGTTPALVAALVAFVILVITTGSIGFCSK